jgi:5'(3')-deoxyribonucleotidase
MNRIAIDIDEVLVPFLNPMARYHRQKSGIRKTDKPKFDYVYRDIFNVTEEESQKMVREFYESPHFQVLQPIRGSRRVMYKFRHATDKLYVITGRQDIVREETERWIDRHFPGIFDDIIFTNSYTPNELKKVDLCRALNIGLIIDDNMGICNECIASGIQALNFVGENTYPWCEESEISLHGWNHHF